MKILFIGGTGTISEAITKLLLSKGEEVWLLNRGSRNADLEGAKHICCDIGDEEKAAELLNGMSFDCVAILSDSCLNRLCVISGFFQEKQSSIFL